MRSLSLLKSSPLAFAALALSGCLVSETPILNAENGKARALKPGDYQMCPLSDDVTPDDCDPIRITKANDYAIHMVNLDDASDVIELRFRRIARSAYAVQQWEVGDDGYMYYYGKGNAKSFVMTLMICSDLPDRLRADLISKGDLEPEDESFDSCVVETADGLVQSAKAYHRGEAVSDEPMSLEFTQAPAVQ